MPRPASGYKTGAGLQVPGTSDIIKRFMNRDALLYWAFNRGKAGHAKLYDDSVLDIGTAVHTMAELDMKGESAADIEFYLAATLRDEDHRDKARGAFSAFRQWRAEFAVEAERQEISLVSEKLAFGGTLDTVAHIRKGRGLLDFKSSTKGVVYEDHVLQLAAYGILWEETHPGEPLDEGYHLIVLPKDGSRPIHREFTHEQLHPYRQKFWLYRQAYNYDAVCNDPATLKGAPVKPSKPRQRPRTEAPAPKERLTIPPRPATMAEILRTYGHLQPIGA
jgi:hypothetical protein